MNPSKRQADRFDVTGAILAGGESSRMGRPKHALNFRDGRTMIEAVADALQSCCRNVVIVGGSNVAADFKHIADIKPGFGPLAGIEALLASRFDSHYIVSPCDVPLIDQRVVGALMSHTEHPITVLQQPGKETFDPLPMRIEAAALDSIRRQLAEPAHSVHQFVESMNHHIVDIDETTADALCNVNTPEQYEQLVASIVHSTSVPVREQRQ